MRFRHIFSETGAGLRQNLTMTLAVIMTMWVSLSLFGAGLLASQQVDLMKGRWYDKIEISIFLCTADVQGDGLALVLEGLLGTGGSSNLRVDQIGKSVGEYLRSRYVTVPEDLPG